MEAGEGAVSRDTRIFALCLGALSLMILGASTLATAAIAHGASTSLRLPFLLMCHGIPHRCLMLFGAHMPICARCVAIYAGFIGGIALFPIAKRIEERVMRIVLAVAATPIFLDGITQATGLRESTNPLRMATGLMVGAAFGSWVLVAIETRARQRFAES